MSALESIHPRPWGVLRRLCWTLALLVSVPPFIVLAVLPMLLLLAPVALIGLPFVICAFVPMARSEQPLARSNPSLRCVARPILGQVEP